MDIFNSLIHHWYSLYKRDLPWRDTRSPYFIWLSEIILQQTRIEQGMACYMSFTEEFPTISDLANASEDKILKLWQGLGYYSRARNLHFTAKYIAEHFNGKFPVIETTSAIGIEALLSMPEVNRLIAAENSVVEKVEDWKIHLLTHQKINYRIIKVC